jgi:hypothetical protein
MGDGVAVGVPGERELHRDGGPAEDERPTGFEPVRIVADADPECGSRVGGRGGQRVKFRGLARSRIDGAGFHAPVPGQAAALEVWRMIE